MKNLMKSVSSDGDDNKKPIAATGTSGIPVGKGLTINTGKSAPSTTPSKDDIVEEAELNVDPNSSHRIIEKKHSDGKYSKVFVDRATGSSYSSDDNERYDAPNLNGTLDAAKYKRTILPKDWMEEYRKKPSTVIVSSDDSKKEDATKISLSAMAKNK